MTPRGRAARLLLALVAVAGVGLAPIARLSPEGQFAVATMAFAALH